MLAYIHSLSEIFSFRVIFPSLCRFFETKNKILHINSHFLLHIWP